MSTLFSKLFGFSAFVFIGFSTLTPSTSHAASVNCQAIKELRAFDSSENFLTNTDLYKQTEAAKRLIEVAACPMSEVAWYNMLRQVEFGWVDMRVSIGGRTFASHEEMLKDAYARFPHSARIKTIVARYYNSAAYAQEALVINPNYLPAKMVLARVFMDNGNFVQAKELLENMNLHRVVGGHTLLASAHFSLQEMGAAKAALSNEFSPHIGNKRADSLIEPASVSWYNFHVLPLHNSLSAMLKRYEEFTLVATTN